MAEAHRQTSASHKSPSYWLFLAFIGVGAVTFIWGMRSAHPAHAWQTYLINFLLWSAIAQGAVLFSAVMHMTNARWSGPLASLSEAFHGFFPDFLFTVSPLVLRQKSYLPLDSRRSARQRNLAQYPLSLYPRRGRPSHPVRSRFRVSISCVTAQNCPRSAAIAKSAR